jgi:hypothetical protein
LSGCDGSWRRAEPQRPTGAGIAHLLPHFAPEIANPCWHTSCRLSKAEGRVMQQIKNGYRGLGVLIGMNADLLLYVATLALALFAAGYLGTL